MITQDIKKLIENNPLALATSVNNKPHVIAVGDVKVIGENQLLIGDNYMKTTIENIKINNNVSLCVWDNKKGSKANGFSLDGQAEYYNSGNYLEIVKKIHVGCPAKGAILVTLNRIKVSA